MNGITLNQLLEALAVILAIAYLLLAARQNLWCWACAFVSSCLYVWLFRDVSLLMEALLNVFYVVMAVVGWWQWTHGAGEGKQMPITSLSWWQHLMLVAGMIIAAALNGWVMANYTDAVWPFVDSFTTWAAVINTFLVIRKVLENWLYWIIIDGISVYLYIDRGLYMTALLFCAYIVIVVFGYSAWRATWRRERAAVIDS